jgi:uncharacterized SAM-binding protein YcdF (DUF218 family)
VAAGVFGLCGWAAAAVWVDRIGSVAEAPRAGCAIVVLGARVEPGGTPSPTLKARIDEGIRVASGSSDLLLFSGGVGDHAPAEAEVGASLARASNVPAHRILVETKSHSTLENAEYSAGLLRAAGISCVHLVTDPSHLARARWAFEHQGLEVTRGPVLRAPRHLDPFERGWWSLREVPAFARLVLMAR